MMYSKLKMILIFFMVVSCAQDRPKNQYENGKSADTKEETKQKDHHQVFICISDSFESTTGILQMMEWKNEAWQAVLDSIPVSFGKNGLAWGYGLHKTQDGNEKKEGDGKSPAGIFEIGAAFGYDAEIENKKCKYRQITANTMCIEDASSQYYNQIINCKEKVSDWNSKDMMLRGDNLYKYGFFLNHNPDNLPENGSCIFFHIWKEANAPSVGCTAMAEENMLKVIENLDHSKNPILMQMPRKDYARLVGTWNRKE